MKLSGNQNTDALASVPTGIHLSEIVLDAMIDARCTQRAWAATAIAHRLKLVRKLRRLLADNALALAEASGGPRSRPVGESLTAEVMPFVEACLFLERQAAKVLAPRRAGLNGRPLWLWRVKAEIGRDPLGVILIIGPGNYPLLLPGIQIVQAFVAGNAVLLKPALAGTRVAALLRDLALQAGFPPHLLKILPESADAARAAMAAMPDKVLFTGSAGTGQKILAQLAPGLTPATMELSGSDAVIVRADADLDLTTRALVFGLTLNNGDTCMCPRRVFVSRSVATELEGRLERALSGRQFSVPSAEGPVRMLVQEALDQGAHFIAGSLPRDGSLRLPIVLAGVSPQARLLHADIFGALLAIVIVKNDEESISLANHCPFGLGASIFSRDEAAAGVLARRLNTGVVTINDLVLPTADPRLPFGGRKHSGFGVTRGPEGLLELTAPKVVTVTRGTFRPALDAPRCGDTELIAAYLKLANTGGFRARWTAAKAFIQAIIQRQKANQKNTV